MARFLNFYVSHGSTARILRGGKKCYIYFVGNLLFFAAVKNFQNQSTVNEVIAESSSPRFLNTVYMCTSKVTAVHLFSFNAENQTQNGMDGDGGAERRAHCVVWSKFLSGFRVFNTKSK